ncbi:oligosaccharide flippase family protein [Vagococcus intermedius]|uniref:Oligosaccharide flippase family protein n=1 Tax=Vagococcus intermedius TaxID=2991418 RepID=A0AAF0I828_9ENTE|nr:oligosaccharide flippase family protein [Vagococcus intermedius]WEG73799.1 oligosaccharide flippase family protein [Vagococcus intermedius]WEG75884.1 oligosaccharide flippase family protein [Vagococcus intermedius]
MTNRRTKKLLFFNIVYSGLYQILVLIVPLLTTPYVTRIFNVEQMGSYGASLALANLFSYAAKMGMGYYGNRKIAQADSKEEYSADFFSLFKIQFISSIVFFFIFIVITVPFGKRSELYLIQSLFILFGFFDVSWFFIGMEDMKKVVVRNMLTKILTTIAIFIFVKKSTDLTLYAFIVVLGILLGNLFMWYRINTYIDFSYRKEKIKKNHIGGSFRLMVPFFLNNMYTTVDRNYLLWLSNSFGSVGVYDQGRKIINILQTFCNASIDAVMPRMAFMSKEKNSKDYIDFIQKGLKICIIISILLVSGILTCSEYFVPLFFGPGYGDVRYVMEISSLAFIIFPTSIFLSNGVMVSSSKDKNFLAISIVMILSSALFNIVLDSKYLFIGASIAYIFTEIIGFCMKINVLKEIISIRSIFINVVIIMIGSFFSIVMIKLINRYIDLDSSISNLALNILLNLVILFILLLIISMKKIKTRILK